MIEFSNIPASLKYPFQLANVASEIRSIHSTMISAFISQGDYSRQRKKKIIEALNVITYKYYVKDALPDGWSPNDPLTNMESPSYSDLDLMVEKLNDLYINYSNVDWSILEQQNSSESVSATHTSPPITMSYSGVTQVASVQNQDSAETPKENLWLKPRDIPRFENPAVCCQSVTKDGRTFQFFRSIPQIPTMQREITITTEVNRMTDSAIDKLYPKQFIRTRKPCMYEPLNGAYMHEQLGLILKICDFTREQTIDNIVKYPHLYIIRRVVDGASKNFFADIEIDGTLYPVMDVWDTLDDTKNLPKTKEFIQEYVIRRYLLERDIKHIEHKYPMDCNLQPYLTLFMPKTEYIRYGFIDIGRDHVRSRVAYLQSLNPMLRSLSRPRTPYCVSACPFADQCTDPVCDGSCPRYVEFTYLLERNGIQFSSPVFQASDDKIERAKRILHTSKNLVFIEETDPAKVVETSNLIAYVACCEKWKGNCLNCSVYHLRFSDYLNDEVQKGISKKIADKYEYATIWMDYASILIISDFDCVNLYNKQAGMLNSLIRDRERNGKKTIIVSSKLNTLSGEGRGFENLKKQLREAVIR